MQLFTEYCTDIHFFSYNFYQNLFFLTFGAENDKSTRPLPNPLRGRGYKN